MGSNPNPVTVYLYGTLESQWPKIAGVLYWVLRYVYSILIRLIIIQILWQLNQMISALNAQSKGYCTKFAKRTGPFFA